MIKQKLAAVTLAAALVIIIGGVYYGTKGEEVQREAEEAVHTENEGGTAAYGPYDGISTGPTGSEPVKGPVQESLGSGKDISEPVPPAMAAAEGTYKEVSRGSNRPGDDFSNYTSLGTFKVTAYTAGPESTGKSPGDPLYGITATGAEVSEGHTIAADWKVLPPGTRIYVEGVGERVIQDRGGAVKGQHIDLYIPELDDALDWGVREREIFLIEWGTD